MLGSLLVELSVETELVDFCLTVLLIVGRLCDGFRILLMDSFAEHSAGTWTVGIGLADLLITGFEFDDFRSGLFLIASFFGPYFLIRY